MDAGVLVVSVLFGMVGMGMFMYGKNAHRMVPLGAGVGLMVIPYFIPNVIALLLVCGVITAVPLVVKES